MRVFYFWTISSIPYVGAMTYAEFFIVPASEATLNRNRLVHLLTINLVGYISWILIALAFTELWNKLEACLTWLYRFEPLLRCTCPALLAAFVVAIGKYFIYARLGHKMSWTRFLVLCSVNMVGVLLLIFAGYWHYI